MLLSLHLYCTCYANLIIYYLFPLGNLNIPWDQGRSVMERRKRPKKIMNTNGE